MDNSGYNNIDDYLTGKLDGKALKTFEDKMKSDQTFSQKVAEQQQAIALLNTIGDIGIKKEAQEAQDIFKKGKKSRSVFIVLRPWIAVAASTVLLVLAYWSFSGSSNEQLFDDYYVAYDTSFGNRDANDSLAFKLATASKFYKDKDYKEAVVLFESIQNFDDSNLKLMTGISQLEIGAYEKALQSFGQLIQDKDPVFLYHGHWYTAMTYLKINDIEKCKAQLKKLIEAKDSNEVFKQDAAKKLLKKI